MVIPEPTYNYTHRDDDWYERNRLERERRTRERIERRAQQGYFIPGFLNREDLCEDFPSLAEQFSGDRDIYEDSHGITHTWGANKIYTVCQDCGCIGYKLTDDISELQKCPAYFCRSRNIRVIRSGDIALAVRNSERGTDMREVYSARRERLRTARAERVAERRNE